MLIIFEHRVPQMKNKSDLKAPSASAFDIDFPALIRTLLNPQRATEKPNNQTCRHSLDLYFLFKILLRERMSHGK